MTRGCDRRFIEDIAVAVTLIALTQHACGCAATNTARTTAREPARALAPDPATSTAEAEAGAEAANGGVEAVVLGPGAQFADLVASAQTSVGSPPADNCLLARTGNGFALGVPAAPAASTWPQPSETATVGATVHASSATPGAGVDTTSPGRVLTPWGLVGSSSEGPLWMAFTPLPASAAQATGLMLELDHDQARLRRTDAAAAPTAAMDHDTLALEVIKQRGGLPVTVYVAATARTPLESLYALLHRLPVDVAVALAVALPAGSSLPPAAEERPVPARCPQGLPELDGNAEEGDLPREQLVAATAPLAAGARHCFESAAGRAASGGRVVVALRIGEHGEVARACIVSPTLGDSVLDTCIAETASQLRFAPPSPRGIVDVHLPLQLMAIESAPPRAVCVQ